MPFNHCLSKVYIRIISNCISQSLRKLSDTSKSSLLMGKTEVDSMKEEVPLLRQSIFIHIAKFVRSELFKFRLICNLLKESKRFLICWFGNKIVLRELQNMVHILLRHTNESISYLERETRNMINWRVNSRTITVS